MASGMHATDFKAGGDRTTAPDSEPRSNIAPNTVSTKPIKKLRIPTSCGFSTRGHSAPRPAVNDRRGVNCASLNTAVVAPPDASADADSESPMFFRV